MTREQKMENIVEALGISAKHICVTFTYPTKKFGLQHEYSLRPFAEGSYKDILNTANSIRIHDSYVLRNAVSVK